MHAVNGALAMYDTYLVVCLLLNIVPEVLVYQLIAPAALKASKETIVVVLSVLGYLEWVRIWSPEVASNWNCEVQF